MSELKRIIEKENTMDAKEEIVISLHNGWTLRCGPGTKHKWGGYVRLCDADGTEQPGCYWDKEEWAADPELVMGAIFAAAEYAENGLNLPDEPYGEQIFPLDETKPKTISERIQEDIITFMGDKNTLMGDRNQVEWLTDQLCQIVVDNFAFAKQS